MTNDPLPFARPGPGTTPPYLYPDYASTMKRSPRRAPIRFEHTLSELTGPIFADRWAGPDITDLTRTARGAPLGEAFTVEGRVLDEDGRPVPGTLLELWQCNAAGRYHHPVDQHDAPLDPNFTGAGQVVTGADGSYRFLTIKPGAYPWRNQPNAWRPAHIHFGVFGPGFATRLATQMYFPAAPRLASAPSSPTNAAGRYTHPDGHQEDTPLDPHFRSFGRAATDADGHFRLVTIKPGPVPGSGNALQAPHINVALFARGLLKHLYTRIYFADEAANASDPLLSAIEDPAARRSLLAQRTCGGTSALYRFDFVLQGDEETAFLDIW